MDHIADYGGGSHIFLSGHSAGAHIVTLLGLDERFLAEQELPLATIRGIVGMSGPYDLLATLADHLAADLNRDDPQTHLAAIMGGVENLEAASPARYARADAPPMLLIHGTADPLVPPEQAELLTGALQAAGAPVELQIVAEMNHFDMVLSLFGRYPQNPFSVAQAVDEFMRRL